MRLLKVIVLLIVLVVVGAVFLDFFNSVNVQAGGDWNGAGNNYSRPIRYSQNITKINVTVDDVYKEGLKKTFSILDPDDSPFIFKESPNGEVFRRAVIDALSRNANEIKPEQYFYAADLAGFLKLNKINSSGDNKTEYYIINPEIPYFLRIEKAVPTNVSNATPPDVGITYPPSAEIGVNKRGAGKFDVHYTGYHGEKKVKFVAVCNGITRERIVDRGEGWKWNKDFYLSLPVDTSNCGGATSYHCTLYVKDTLVLNLDQTYTINRSFRVGEIDYYFKPKCEWKECHEHCSTDDEGHEHCHTHCHKRCRPCSNIEQLSWSSEQVPDWAKKNFSYRHSPAAEEYLLRMYAEAVKDKTEKVRKETMAKIKDNGQWELYFGKLDDVAADRLLQYFYLVQIPLNIYPDDSANASRLGAILDGKANRSIISSLYTLFENTTYLNVTRENISIYTYLSNFGNATTNITFVLLGEGQNFSVDYIPSDCGDVVVAELANYRQPALQNFRSTVRIPDSVFMHMGYSPSYGVIYEIDTRACRLR